MDRPRGGRRPRRASRSPAWASAEAGPEQQLVGLPAPARRRGRRARRPRRGGPRPSARRPRRPARRRAGAASSRRARRAGRRGPRRAGRRGAATARPRRARRAAPRTGGRGRRRPRPRRPRARPSAARRGRPSAAANAAAIAAGHGVAGHHVGLAASSARRSRRRRTGCSPRRCGRRRRRAASTTPTWRTARQRVGARAARASAVRGVVARRQPVERVRAVGGLDDRLRGHRADARPRPGARASRRRTSATARPRRARRSPGRGRRSSRCRGASAREDTRDDRRRARARARPRSATRRRASCAPTATSPPARRASPAPCCPRCDDPDVPWHRIVRADGSLAKGARQRALLEAEGVPVPRRARGHARRAAAPPATSGPNGPSCGDVGASGCNRRYVSHRVSESGKRHTQPRGTEISLRGVTPAAVGTVTVTGSRSGAHAGTLRRSTDGKGELRPEVARLRPASA